MLRGNSSLAQRVIEYTRAVMNDQEAYHIMGEVDGIFVILPPGSVSPDHARIHQLADDRAKAVFCRNVMQSLIAHRVFLLQHSLKLLPQFRILYHGRRASLACYVIVPQDVVGGYSIPAHQLAHQNGGAVDAFAPDAAQLVPHADLNPDGIGIAAGGVPVRLGAAVPCHVRFLHRLPDRFLINEVMGGSGQSCAAGEILGIGSGGIAAVARIVNHNIIHFRAVSLAIIGRMTAAFMNLDFEAPPRRFGRCQQPFLPVLHPLFPLR